MKIAIVCPYDYFRPGGVQSHIREVYAELKNRGHTVKIIAPRTMNSRDETDVIFLGSNKSVGINSTKIDINIAIGKEYFELKRTLKDEQFDIIHYHTIWNPFIAFQILFTNRNKSRNVATFHDTPPDTILGKLLSYTVMPVLAYVLIKLFFDAVIVVSESPKSIISRIYKGKLNLIPNGVNLESYSKDESLDKYKDKKNIFYIGRLEERKGVIYLIKAFENLKHKYSDIRLLIAGTGELQTELQNYAKERNLSDIEFLGYISDADKISLYKSSYLFVSPAMYGESQGIVLLEAMAAGTLPLGANNSGYITVLKNEGKELLFNAKDVSDLESHLELYLTNEVQYKKMLKWANLEVKKYDWKIIVSQLENIYLMITSK